jgi:hypothetical protein
MKNLPELPRIHKQREASFGIRLRKWIADNPLPSTCSIETKDSRGKDRFYLSELKPEQITYAKLIKDSPKGVLLRVQGTDGQPDYVYLKQEPAYIGFKFPDCMCLISIDKIIKENSKSLTSQRAKELAEFFVI